MIGIARKQIESILMAEKPNLASPKDQILGDRCQGWWRRARGRRRPSSWGTERRALHRWGGIWTQVGVSTRHAWQQLACSPCDVWEQELKQIKINQGCCALPNLIVELTTLNSNVPCSRLRLELRDLKSHEQERKERVWVGELRGMVDYIYQVEGCGWH